MEASVRTRTALIAAAAVGALALSGCSGDTEVADPPPDPPAVTESATESEAPVSEFEEAAMLVEPDAGGTVDPAATMLNDQTVVDFVATLSAPLGDRIVQTVSELDVAPGQSLYGAVVAVGCSEPESATASLVGAEVHIVAVKPETKEPQCLVPITTVALMYGPGV